MKHFKEIECQRQEQLIDSSSRVDSSNLFGLAKGYGLFMGKRRPFVLDDGIYNLYAPIRDDVMEYFKQNNIKWWGGDYPSGHILSSQMACLNHLFPIRRDKDAVLRMINSVRDEFTEVLPITTEGDSGFIAFEMVSDSDYLNEGVSTRGSNCTSVDAFVYACHQSGELWLLPIEWKYTERYSNQDKSNEDRPREPKGTNGKGLERMSRYNALIDESKQLKSLRCYCGSTYYFEPFYQLMRQTLWAEEMIAHKDSERIKAENFLHIHVIPKENHELLRKEYKCSGKDMESTWRDMLFDQSKYTIIDPAQLLTPIAQQEHLLYLKQRYWGGRSLNE